ncbi:MAG: hypothetical protein HZB26_09470 [Candidatus Hydrogenedentes bacterium]|nr:hypothetical protein [Candidatus Hydrogenedentota bacterium]
MKHISGISKKGPSKAAIWQDIVCSVTFLFSDVVSAKGGASPFLDVAFNKCNPTT